MLLRACILSTALLAACGDAGGPSSSSTGTTGELTTGLSTTDEESTGGGSTGPTLTPAEVCAMGVGQPCDFIGASECVAPLDCRFAEVGNADSPGVCVIPCLPSVDDLDCPGYANCGPNGYCDAPDSQSNEDLTPACPDFEGSTGSSG